MPLINLTTNLKSLPYGSDRPGGASSGEPFIVSPLPSQAIRVPYARQLNLFDNFYELNKNTSDFPIRGGSIELDTSTGRLTTVAGRIDFARIQAFLDNKQKGTIFKLKQAGLQLSNPKMQVPGAIATLVSNQSGFVETTRTYNPTGITTAQQVLTSGTGIHIPRHGATADYGGLFTRGYAEFIRANNTLQDNRLVILTKSKIANESPISIYSGRAADYGISVLNNQILNYPGGPGSTYGIGGTVIKRDVNTNTGVVYNTISYTYDTIQKQNTTEGTDRAHPRVQDFRKAINNQTGKEQLMTEDYESDRFGYATGRRWYSAVNTGNQGAAPLKARVDYSKTLGNIDDVNCTYPYTMLEEDTPWTTYGFSRDIPKDIIKFSFECLDNDYIGTATALLFRAFLTSFTDNNQAEFNSFKYLGRGETFRAYQGFDRSINFGFKIAAFSRDEMQPLYTKLNHLISQVYPDYSPKEGFMRGSIIKLTVGDYLYRVPGFLENVNVTIDSNASWEIALDKTGKDKDMAELPQLLDVQCTFKPIHNILPRRVTTNAPEVPLIADTPSKYIQQTDPNRVFTHPSQILKLKEGVMEPEEVATRLADQAVADRKELLEKSTIPPRASLPNLYPSPTPNITLSPEQQRDLFNLGDF